MNLNEATGYAEENKTIPMSMAHVVMELQSFEICHFFVFFIFAFDLEIDLEIDA